VSADLSRARRKLARILAALAEPAVTGPTPAGGLSAEDTASPHRTAEALLDALTVVYGLRVMVMDEPERATAAAGPEHAGQLIVGLLVSIAARTPLLTVSPGITETARLRLLREVERVLRDGFEEEPQGGSLGMQTHLVFGQDADLVAHLPASGGVA
jgi:hypothetical protein